MVSNEILLSVIITCKYKSYQEYWDNKPWLFTNNESTTPLLSFKQVAGYIDYLDESK